MHPLLRGLVPSSLNSNFKTLEASLITMIIFFLSISASRNPKFLNLKLLADHVPVIDLAFCNTEHGPEFFRAIDIAANSKSCENVCKHLYVMKMCKESIQRFKYMDSHQSEHTQRSLLQNEMIFCKHDTLLSCFLFQIQTSNFKRKKKSFNGAGRSL